MNKKNLLPNFHWRNKKNRLPLSFGEIKRIFYQTIIGEKKKKSLPNYHWR
jgi:hypothetical protein